MIQTIGLLGLVLVIFLLLSVLGRGARAGQQLRIIRRHYSRVLSDKVPEKNKD